MILATLPIDELARRLRKLSAGNTDPVRVNQLTHEAAERLVGLQDRLGRERNFAKAFGIDRREFAKRALQESNLFLYAELFDADEELAAEIEEVAKIAKAPKPKRNPK